MNKNTGLWTPGPDLPSGLYATILVPISQYEVLIIGGKRNIGTEVKSVWHYNDLTQTYEARNDAPRNRFGKKCAKIYLMMKGKEVVMCLSYPGAYEAEIYDIEMDQWIDTSQFKTPVHVLYGLMVVRGNRYCSYIF